MSFSASSSSSASSITDATAPTAQPPAPLATRMRAWLAGENGPLALLALIYFVTHMLVAGNYGYFRDELYYLEGGRHLAFGYVDFEPVIAVLAALMDALTRDNLVAIHVIPAAAGACLVFVTGLMARELGGGRFAQWLAALGSAVTLVFLATGSIFSMDILDALLWTLCAYILIRILRRDQPRLWLLFGLVAGIGLMTKLTILFFGLAVVVGLLLTPARRLFRTRWPWLGGLIALVIFSPFIIWNAVNGFPTWEFWHHYGGLSGGGPLGFLANQLFAINPFNLGLIVAGLLFYFRGPQGKPYRALGWAYVFLYVVFTIINAKSYFLTPAYPLLYAGGGVVLARGAWRPGRAWAKPALAIYAAILILSGLLLAPLTMPVLSPTTYAQTYGHLTFLGNGGAGQQTAGIYPQYLGDRFGWDTMTAQVAQVYNSLPPDERAQACIFTDNYGEASAINFFGPQYHLPPAISGHNNYYLWGPGACSGKVLITVDEAQSDLQKSYGSVVQKGTITCSYCMTYEDNLPIYVCTQPKVSVRDAWRTVKHFN
ncbi:MAG: glycosyltransferase family 39 protein [Ktedonobacterales bacterium]